MENMMEARPKKVPAQREKAVFVNFSVRDIRKTFKRVYWSGQWYTQKDIEDRIAQGIPEQPFLSTKEVGEIPNDKVFDWHAGRVLYYINHPEEIRDIILRKRQLGEETIYALSNGTHRTMAAYILKMESVVCRIVDFENDFIF